MSYFPASIGLGAEPPSSDLIDPSNFNDTKFPGMAYATNPQTHAVFLDLQNQLNRAAAARNIATRIPLDGKIGTRDTLPLAQQISKNSVATSSVRSLAMNAKIVALAAKAKADAAGVAAKPPAPKPSEPPMIYDAKQDKLAPAPAASLIDSFMALGTPTMLALGVGAAVIGYYLWQEGKR